VPDPPMRGKQVLYTALIALGVVVGFQSYQAKKG
jgi:predicted negative regulator of RcsB-dependent stress response